MQGKKQEEFKENSASYYMGLADLKIVAINPNLIELNALLGATIEKEPVYKDVSLGKDKDGNEKTANKIVIYLSNKQIVECTDSKTDTITKDVKTVTGRIEFLVKPELELASTGSKRFINSLGNATWSQSLETILANEKMDWFYKNEPIVEAYQGEAALLSFFKAYLYINYDETAGFKNRKSIMETDVTELRQYVKSVPNNEITCLLGVTVADNGKTYQQIYNKCFTRATAKNPITAFNKALNEQYGEFKAEYSKDFKLREYSATAKLDMPDKEQAKSDFSSSSL